MRSIMLRTMVVAGALSALAAPSFAIFHAVFDEFGRGQYETADNQGQWITMTFSIAPDPTGGIVGAPVLIYDLPEIVGSGDVNFFETDGQPNIDWWSDTFRFYDDAVGSHLIFYSDNRDGVDSPADVGIPQNLDPNAPWVMETGFEGGLQVCVWDPLGWPNNNRYDGVSDYPVPEPATMAVLGLGSIALLRRRRR